MASGDRLEYHPTAGMRRYIDSLPKTQGVKVACFDTRFEKSAILTGSAAKTIAGKLRRLGYRIVVDPESFFVLHTEGPLKEAELDRARDWARRCPCPRRDSARFAATGVSLALQELLSHRLVEALDLAGGGR